MTYDYEKLWKLLNEKGISKSNLKMIAHIGSATLAKMSKGQMVSMMVIEKICKALHCDIGEICHVSRMNRQNWKQVYR